MADVSGQASQPPAGSSAADTQSQAPPSAVVSPMAALFPDSKACRLQFTFSCLSGRQTVTDDEDVFVSQLEKEGRLEKLEELNKTFNVTEVTVDTAKQLVLVSKKGRMSLEGGRKWVDDVRKKIRVALGDIISEVIQGGELSAGIHKSVEREFSKTKLSCLLSHDKRSLLLLSSDAQDVAKAKEFVAARLQTASDKRPTAPLAGPASPSSTVTPTTQTLSSVSPSSNQPARASTPLGPAAPPSNPVSDLPAFAVSAPPLQPTVRASSKSGHCGNASTEASASSAAASQQTTKQLVLSADRADFPTAERMASKPLDDTEAKEEELDALVAMYLQGVKGRKVVQSLEDRYSCQVTVSSPWQRSLWTGRTPRGHQVLVCEGSVAVTDCEVIVLPLSDGQSEWPPRHKHILERSFLNPNLSVYASEVGPPPQPRTMTLLCNTAAAIQGDHVTASQSILIVSVPQAADKRFSQRVDKACGEAFRKLKARGATSIAIPVMLSAAASNRKCLDVLLPAVARNLEKRRHICTVMLCVDPLTSAERGELAKALQESRLNTTALAGCAAGGSGHEQLWSATSKPAVVLRGQRKDVTTVFSQIQRVKVPEEFRRHATRLLNFLQDQPAPPLSHSARSGGSPGPANSWSDRPLLQHGQGVQPTRGSPKSPTQQAPNSSTSDSALVTATSPTETKVTGQPRAIKRATGRSRDRVAFEAPPASHQPQVAFQAPPASHQPKAAFQAPPASQEPGPRGSLAGVAPFVTKSGLKVHVYKADITKLPVDAIVCATGENQAVFGVPKQICAESYLSAVQKFDDLRGGSTTSLTHIHFVDVDDAKVTTIEITFKSVMKRMKAGDKSSKQLAAGDRPSPKAR